MPETFRTFHYLTALIIIIIILITRRNFYCVISQCVASSIFLVVGSL